MTLVIIDLGKPDVEGVVPDDTRVGLQPTRRRNSGATVVLPKSFSVVPVGGVAVVELAATGPDWCWRISEYAGQDGIVRHVAVPDVPEVTYTDLVDVDPATLEPTAEPTAAWWAALEQAQIGIYATAVPGHPELVEIHYPVWGTLPGHSNILIMPIQEAQP